jgi:hypothetical protein
VEDGLTALSSKLRSYDVMEAVIDEGLVGPLNVADVARSVT